MKLMEKFLERNRKIKHDYGKDYYSDWQDKFWYFMSIPVVKILQYTPITPNMVTFDSVLFVYLSALFFALNHPFIAVALLYGSEWADRVDGALARVKNQKSVLRCSLLCKWYHQCAFALLFFGIGFGLFIKTGWIIYLFLGFLASFSQQFTAYFLELRKFILLKYRNDKTHTKKRFVENKFQALCLRIITFPNVNLFHILLIFTIINKLNWLLWFYAVFLSIRAILFVIHTYYNFMKMEEKKNEK